MAIVFSFTFFGQNWLLPPTKTYRRFLMSDLFTFRKYKKEQGKKKTKHYKLIVDDYENEYGFMGLTKSKYKGRGHKNLELIDNPQFVSGKRSSEKSYLRRKIEYDKKRYFSEVSLDYQLSDVDKRRLEPYVKKHKKKR